jgi:DNA polymerase-4
MPDAPAQTDPRKIVHVDMDAFYASIEQRDNPALRGLPVAVGGSHARGVVAAASYEARVFGVRSAMASVTAVRRCPALVFVPPRFDTYRAVSQQIRAIFAAFTPIIEPLSLDEAYLDVTGLGSATRIAEAIRARIRAETGLTASAGVSYNKFIAKMASDQNKPDGLCVIPPGRGEAFVAGLPVRRFHGVGPVTAARMEALGIRTGADLRAVDLGFLQRHFGSRAAYLHAAARGQDDRPVRADRVRKSLGAETTFTQDLIGRAALLAGLEEIVDTLWERHVRANTQARTITLKVRFADFRTVTRARTLGHAVTARETLAGTGAALIDGLLPLELGVRLLGLTLSGLSGMTEEREPSLPL